MFLSVLFLLFRSGFPPNTSFSPGSVVPHFSFASNQIFQRSATRNQPSGLDYSVFPQKGSSSLKYILLWFCDVSKAFLLCFSHITKPDHKGKGNTVKPWIPAISTEVLTCATSSLRCTAMGFCLRVTCLCVCVCLMVIPTRSDPKISDPAQRLDSFLGTSLMGMETDGSCWAGFTEVVGVRGEPLGGTEVWEPVLLVGVGCPFSSDASVERYRQCSESPRETIREIKSTFTFGSKKERPSRWPST